MKKQTQDKKEHSSSRGYISTDDSRISDSKNNIVLDIRGQICPACLLISLKELNAKKELIKAGERSLVVFTDHRDATRTIPNAVTAMGYSVNVKKKDGYYEITIKKERQT